jgi:hypothetical protein
MGGATQITAMAMQRGGWRLGVRRSQAEDLYLTAGEEHGD